MRQSFFLCTYKSLLYCILPRIPAPVPLFPVCMKYLFVFCALALSPIALFGQISFHVFPENLQLYPRSVANNTAQITLSGTAAPGPDSLIFTLEKSDGAIVRKTLAINDLSNGQFEVNFDITAGRWFYQVKAEITIGANIILLRVANNIVAGDVFAVEGQSNAQAIAFNGDANIWQNNFVRCYSTSNPDVFNDTNWYLAEGNGYFSPGAVGQWALRMGYLLQENLQVPVAIINGADPGKPIEFFQRNDAEPLDSTTNYGRLLQRCTRAGVREHIRGMLFYQGESDGGRADVHKNLFEALHADWEADYPNIEVYYVVQVREGCGSPSLQLREYQRNFETYLPRTHAVTANGINGHDGCHYSVQGYQTLGEKIYHQISNDLYQVPTGKQANIRVLSARFSDDLNQEITLVTDAQGGLLAQPGSVLDFRLQGASASVIGLVATGNTLVLTLDQSVDSPGAGISYGGHSGNDAWILNGDGYGLFTYYNIGIDNYHPVPNFGIPGILSGSGNCIALDGTDDYVYVGPVLGASYTKEAWINWNGISFFNNLVSGAAGTAFWVPYGVLSAGHNGEWQQVVDNTILPSNQWVHVAVTYDASTLELSLYKNGRMVSQAQNIPAHNDPEVFIGAFSGCCTFQGKIDEVRIWDAVRGIDDIRASMCHKLPDSYPNLSSYFRFDETAGNVAPNSTGAANGQLLNFQALGWQTAWKRSGAPIGTSSAYSYQDVAELKLDFSSGDRLTLLPDTLRDFAHLYLVEEVPNVLQAPDPYVLVDNHLYFGLFYPNQSMSSYELNYQYANNPFAAVQAPKLGALQRRNNEGNYWTEAEAFLFDTDNLTLRLSGEQYQEYILALRDSVMQTPLAVQIAVVQTILCSGLNNGVLQATAWGGQPPYAYRLNGGSPQPAGVFSGLAPGDYSVVVTDQTGAEISTQSVLLQSPAPLLVSLSVQANNATLTPSGGTAPYQINSTAPDSTLQNLPNGTYDVMVTDANGCQFNSSFTIDYQILTIDYNLINFNPCDEYADLLASANGGAPPYVYSLNNGPFQTSNAFLDLPAGSYELSVRDAEGTVVTYSPFIVNVIPNVLNLFLLVESDTLIVLPGGGLPPYQYSLNGTTPQSDSVFSGLLPGYYTVQITDERGCSALQSIAIEVNGTVNLRSPFGLQVTPNPSTGLFFLHGNQGSKILQVSILDALGKRVESLILPEPPENWVMPLDLRAQAEGLYFIQVTDGQRIEQLKLLKLN